MPLSKVKSKLESQVSGMMGVTLLNLGDTAIDGKKQIQTTNKVVKWYSQIVKWYSHKCLELRVINPYWELVEKES